MTQGDRISDLAVCPWEVERPTMVQRWETLTFLHWRFEAATVQRVVARIGAAGFPTPTEESLVHFSPGVNVRIGPFEP